MFLAVIVTFLSAYVIAVFAMWLKKHRKVRNIINKIPGPHEKPVVGVLPHFLSTPDNVWRYFREVSSKHYPIYKYWWVTIPVVNFISPEDIEVIFASTKHSRKSMVYDSLMPWLGTGLLTSEGAKWQSRRKILTPTFHFNILQQFLSVFVEESELLVKELEQECQKPSTDVVPIVSRYTLYTICETAMGTKLKRGDETSQTYIDAVYRMGQVLFHRSTRPWFIPDAIYALSSYYREQTKLLKTLHSFSMSVIEKRMLDFKDPELEQPQAFSKKSKRLVMLDLLISAKNAGVRINDEEIREEVDTFMFEGHDTTAACLSFTLMLLANHQDVQERVFEELKEVLGDTNRAPTYEDLQNLRYLDLVLKESLRMYPSVPFVSRLTDEEFRTPSGYMIPKNVTVQVHIYDVHHNPQLYPDPEKFDPDRFLPENSLDRHPFAYLPFSAGPRNCIGQKFAFLEIKTAISAILRNFVLKPIDTPASMTIISHLILKAEDGVRVKFEKRAKL